LLGVLVLETIAFSSLLSQESARSASALLGATVGVLVPAVLAVIFYFARLSVRVDRDFLHIRFLFFLRKDIPLDEIAEWQACVYRPILDYGGWGIRYSLTRKGWAYNVSGRQGVQI